MARPRLNRPNFRLVVRDGRYYIRWWADGRWQRVSTGTADRGEASRALIQFEAGYGTPPPPAQPTVSAILDGYLADRTPRVASPATLGYACAALRRHLGELQPDHITREQGRLYVRRRRAEGHQVGPQDARRRKPTADGTISREIVTLRAALRWAVEEGWIAAAPTIEAPSAKPPRDRWLTREEAAQLLAAPKQSHVRVFIALALYTGARTGALLQLRWPAVDLAAGRIDLGAGTGNKRRAVVPIADALRPILEEAYAGRTCDAVVQHGDGPVDSIKTGFRAACTRAGLTDVTPHTLRHTAATWMALAGVPLAEIARYLGDNEQTVERVYAKHSPDYLRRAAAALSGPALCKQIA